MASEDVLTIYDEMAQGVRDAHKSDWEDIAEALAAEVRELRRDRDLLDRLQGGPYFVVRLDAADALNRENVERFRGMGIIRLLDADAAMGGGEGEA